MKTMAQPVLPVLSTTAPTPPHHQLPRQHRTPQPPPVYPRTVRLSSIGKDDHTANHIATNPPGDAYWQHHTPFDTPPGGVPLKQMDLGTSTVSVSPPQETSTPSTAGPGPPGVFQLHVSTDMQGSAMSTSSGYHVVNTSRSPPSSVQTSSSYRSPTKWTNFEDEEDSEAESTGTSTSPTASRFARLDSHSSGPFSMGPGTGSATALSADLETKNLLDADAFSEADTQSLSEEDPYVMSDEQRIYYVENFKQLQRATQGIIDLNGAIRGAEERVIDFFRKSSLSRDILSKIWQLADVNQDGWLNLDEFCTAMHLIVLHVKGSVPVPDYLPPHIAPSVTPPRDVAEVVETPGSAGPSGNWQNFDENYDSVSKKSDDGPVAPSPMNREFTSVPPPSGLGGAERPVPVKLSPDSDDLPPGTPATFYQPVPTPPRRTRGATDADIYPPGPQLSAAQTAAMQKASTMPVSPAAPKGPPPKPPPRPPHRHARSASLDLTKGFGTANQETSGPTNSKNSEARPADVSQVVSDLPPEPNNSSLYQDEPPSNMPPLPMLPVRDIETQTEAQLLAPPLDDADWPDVGIRRSRLSGAPPIIDLGEEAEAEAGGSGDSGEPSGPPLDWKGRCRKLEKTNEELERERVKLAETRLYLEIQLQKLKG